MDSISHCCTVVAVAALTAATLDPAVVRAQDTAIETLPTEIARAHVAASPAVEAEAADWLRRMQEALAAERSFAVHASISYDEVYRSSAKLQFSGSVDLYVRRPHGVMIDYDGELEKKRFWYDGSSCTLLDKDENAYATVLAPASIGAMLDEMVRRYDLVLPLEELLQPDFYERTLDVAEVGMLLGTAWVGDVECVHLAFAEPTIDWQIWLERGRRPLPRKLVATYKTMPSAPQFEALLDGWNTLVSLPETTFEPDTGDATRIEFLPAGAGY